MKKIVSVILLLSSVTLAQIESDSLSNYFGVTFFNQNFSQNYNPFQINLNSNSLTANINNAINKNSIIPQFSFYFGSKITKFLFNVGSIAINYDSYLYDFEDEYIDNPSISVLSIAPLYGIKNIMKTKHSVYPYYFIGFSKVFTKVNLDHYLNSTTEEKKLENRLQKMMSPMRGIVEWGAEIVFAKQFSLGLATAIYCDYVNSKVSESSYLSDDLEISVYKIKQVNIGKEAKINLNVYF